MFTTLNARAEALFIKYYENHDNTILKKENDKFSSTEHKEKEYCDPTDKELKITFMKKFNELQENSERQYNDLRNKMNEQKEYFNTRLKF